MQYRGQHEPLVNAVTWDKVQAVRAAHTNGERTRKHPHWLRSTVYCGLCESRMIVMNARSSTGEYYKYFGCVGKHNKKTDCRMPVVLISEIEKKVTEDYCHNTIPADLRAAVTELVTTLLREDARDTEQEQAQLKRETDKLERERAKLLQAHYADAIDLDTLKKRTRTHQQPADTDRTTPRSPEPRPDRSIRAHRPGSAAHDQRPGRLCQRARARQEAAQPSVLRAHPGARRRAHRNRERRAIQDAALTRTARGRDPASRCAWRTKSGGSLRLPPLGVFNPRNQCLFSCRAF
ncbi:hypothetical protein BHE97_14615 [Aeromicrobium sp. PE09-221]|nr:hypothetical protein BHE97_14615 [Aeromicrobium sp. PE09-221]